MGVLRARRRGVLIAHPSADVYGADLQLLETVTSLVNEGWPVTVALPSSGPLVERLRLRGASVEFVPFPVLRRISASPAALISLAREGLKALVEARHTIQRLAPSLVYVNTVTLPWWIAGARLTRTPTLCHVHEAETRDSRTVRFLLTAPLVLAHRVILNSCFSRMTALSVAPFLQGRTVVIYNGFAGPPGSPNPVQYGSPIRLALISRVSPRKAIDDAIEAVAILRQHNKSVQLTVYGAAFRGYEWFEASIKARVHDLELNELVQFAGYVTPIWQPLEQSDIVLAPSFRESFGNVVVEAQLARRPVVAAAAQGHLEIVEDGLTGLLFAPANPAALAASIEKLLDDEGLAQRLADQGRETALKRFSPQRYYAEIAAMVSDLAQDDPVTS